jgi:Uma2 family endonuclease
MADTIQLDIATPAINYPESDGMPMADNTRQFRLIVMIQGGLDAQFAQQPDVFVAGDLLWYPVEGQPTIRAAPDIMVAFGVPKGDRGAYLQWREGNIAPQVVFEILSPGNTVPEMSRKHGFYNRYGVEEYYLYDLDHHDLSGWRRIDGGLWEIDPIEGWGSPRLGIRFSSNAGELRLFHPDGQLFTTFVELEQRAEREQARAEREQARADQAEHALAAERIQVEELLNRLRALVRSRSQMPCVA